MNKALTKRTQKGSAVAIGNYDGVHFGHRAILKRLKAYARAHRLKAILLTFEPHPVHILAPTAEPQLLNTKSQKTELLSTTGIDAVIFQKFNKKFSHISPQDFFKNTLIKKLKARFVIVGHDFTFGIRRSGTAETLESLGSAHNVHVEVVGAQIKEGTLVSSSLIRKLILAGDIPLANRLLTRSFFIDGVVIHGHARGRQLGIHTANLSTKNQLIPPDGVYATRVRVGKKMYASVTNIGKNPTFDARERSLECHILDFDTNIYRQKIRLFFEQRLRDEIRFATPEDLVKQIKKDIRKVKRGKTPPTPSC